MIRRCLTIITVVCVLLLTSCSHRPTERLLRITVLDVGQGDGIVLESPGGHAIVIDGGPGPMDSDPYHGSAGDEVMVPFLRHEGINTVDVMILTHPHEDHVTGLLAVLHSVRVLSVLDGTVIPLPTEHYHEFLQTILDNHIPYRKARRGTRLVLGDGVVLDCLSPPQAGLPFGNDYSNSTINNYSAVFRVTYGRTKILLDGDAQQEAEDNMLRTYSDSYLKADVLKTGHHGSRNASSAEWLAVVRPSFAVISCGRHNLFGHPNKETLDRLKTVHAAIYRTDQDGAVTIVSDGLQVRVSSFLDVGGTLAPVK
jgi:beta-lactamase superfamily II metal-dependent hydrolase